MNRLFRNIFLRTRDACTQPLRYLITLLHLEAATRSRMPATMIFAPAMPG